MSAAGSVVRGFMRDLIAGAPADATCVVEVIAGGTLQAFTATTDLGEFHIPPGAVGLEVHVQHVRPHRSPAYMGRVQFAPLGAGPWAWVPPVPTTFWPLLRRYEASLAATGIKAAPRALGRRGGAAAPLVYGFQHRAHGTVRDRLGHWCGDLYAFHSAPIRAAWVAEGSYGPGWRNRCALPMRVVRALVPVDPECLLWEGPQRQPRVIFLSEGSL